MFSCAQKFTNKPFYPIFQKRQILGCYNIKAKIVEIRRRVFLEFILPTTMASDSASRIQAALASSSVARRAA